MENQRIRLTKALLKEALICLLEEKSIDKITIQALCSQAQINRTTFYKYYGSQYDLLEEIENDFFTALQTHLTQNRHSELSALQQILEFLSEHQTGYRILLNSVIDQDFVERLFSMPVVRDYLEQSIINQFPPAQRDYVYQFMCHGSYAMIRSWLASSCQEPPADMAALIYRIGTALRT